MPKAEIAGLLTRDAIISFRPRDPEDRLDSRSSLRIPIWGEKLEHAFDNYPGQANCIQSFSHALGQ